jgi:hypothetical protein
MSRADTTDKAQSRKAGEDVEAAVLQVVDELQYVPDRDNQHADATVTRVLDARHDVVDCVGMCLLERGTSVEIKSTMLELGSGRRGRFQIRKNQHDWLLANAGVYLFALCRPSYDRELVALRVVPATLVDELDWSWRDASPGSTRETYAQIAWSQIWNPDDVDTSQVIQ